MNQQPQTPTVDAHNRAGESQGTGLQTTHQAIVFKKVMWPKHTHTLSLSQGGAEFLKGFSCGENLRMEADHHN